MQLLGCHLLSPPCTPIAEPYLKNEENTGLVLSFLKKNERYGWNFPPALLFG